MRNLHASVPTALSVVGPMPIDITEPFLEPIERPGKVERSDGASSGPNEKRHP